MSLVLRILIALLVGLILFWVLTLLPIPYAVCVIAGVVAGLLVFFGDPYSRRRL